MEFYSNRHPVKNLQILFCNMAFISQFTITVRFLLGKRILTVLNTWDLNVQYNFGHLAVVDFWREECAWFFYLSSFWGLKLFNKESNKHTTRHVNTIAEVTARYCTLPRRSSSVAVMTSLRRLTRCAWLKRKTDNLHSFGKNSVS